MRLRLHTAELSSGARAAKCGQRRVEKCVVKRVQRVLVFPHGPRNYCACWGLMVYLLHVLHTVQADEVPWRPADREDVKIDLNKAHSSRYDIVNVQLGQCARDSREDSVRCPSWWQLALLGAELEDQCSRMRCQAQGRVQGDSPPA
eukprot:4743387-Prymnesium_polylepis.3